MRKLSPNQQQVIDWIKSGVGVYCDLARGRFPAIYFAIINDMSDPDYYPRITSQTMTVLLRRKLVTLEDSILPGYYRMGKRVVSGIGNRTQRDRTA